MTAKQPVLELRLITKSYPGAVALERVNFTVYENEIVGLVGENGAGKSTLMKILIGLTQPDEGSYTLRGKPVVLRDPASATRAGVGMVFQEGSLVPNLSIVENLFLCHGSRFRRFGFLSNRAMQEAARSILSLVKVETDLDTPIADATPEVRQMVEIARLHWLVRLYNQRNPILILDEPTTVLTDTERQTLFPILRKIKRQASIVLISHRLQEIVENSDRIVILKDGKNVTELVRDQANIPDIEQMMVGRTFAADRYRENEQVEPQDELLLRVQNLCKRGEFEPIDFSVRRGEIISIVGLVGSGKEAVCRCITGLEKPDSGSISLGGKKLAWGSPSESVRSGIGHIPIDRRSEGLALGMGVAENVNLLVLDRFKVAGLISPAREKRNAVRWIEECRIKSPSVSAMCANLSGGNQQKTVIAKWFSSQVRFLVLAHPTRGVDVGAKEDIYRLIRKLTQNGIGMIIIRPLRRGPYVIHFGCVCRFIEDDRGLGFSALHFRLVVNGLY